MFRSWKFSLGLALVASLFAASCGNDDDPVAPSTPSLSALWPNADGNAWSYQFTSLSLTSDAIQLFDGLDSGTLDRSAAEDLLMRRAPAATISHESRERLDLRLDGTMPTAQGLAQKLEANITVEGKRVLTFQPFMERIYLARADLREEMISRQFIAPSISLSQCACSGPLFAYGAGAFEMTNEGIGYCPINDDATSYYAIAQAPMNAGLSYDQQPVPDLALDIRESVWVLGNRKIETDAGVFENAVAILYFVDYGQCLVPINDNVVPFRSLGLSLLFLAPDVGPVYQTGIDLLPPCSPELGADPVIKRHELSLSTFTGVNP